MFNFTLIKSFHFNNKFFLFPFSCSVQVRHSAVSSLRKASRTMWSSLRVTTLWCTTRCTPWAGGPSSSGATWNTASRRSPWTESTRPTASTTSCSSAQVTLRAQLAFWAPVFQGGGSLMTPPYYFQTRERCWRWSTCQKRVGTTWRSFCWRSWRSSRWDKSDGGMTVV